jgi:hypothetical protein
MRFNARMKARNRPWCPGTKWLFRRYRNPAGTSRIIFIPRTAPGFGTAGSKLRVNFSTCSAWVYGLVLQWSGRCVIPFDEIRTLVTNWQTRRANARKVISLITSTSCCRLQRHMENVSSPATIQYNVENGRSPEPEIQ